MSDFERIISAAADITESVRGWINSPAAERIGRRIDQLSQAAIIPDAGFMTDTNGLAALFAMEIRGVEAMVSRNMTPSAKPGQSRIYRTSDVVGPATEANPVKKRKSPDDEQSDVKL